VQEPRGYTVPQDRGPRGQDDDQAGDRHRLEEALGGPVHDEGRRARQDRHVEKRRHDLRPLVPEGAGDGGAPPPDPESYVGDQDGGKVAEIVDGVGDERHAVRDEAARYLDHGDDEIQDKGDQEPCALGPVPVHPTMRMCMSMGMTMSLMTGPFTGMIRARPVPVCVHIVTTFIIHTSIPKAKPYLFPCLMNAEDRHRHGYREFKIVARRGKEAAVVCP